MGVEEVVIDPVSNYVFGAFSLILIGVLIWFLKVWRHDVNKNQAEWQKQNGACNDVVLKNAVANDKLATSIDAMTSSYRRLHEELIRRPCIVESDEPEN